MMELTYRAFAPDLEVRSAGDGRTVRGLAVPYGVPQRINAHLTEQWARGAFNHQLRAANRVKFAREHLPLGGALLGSATLLRDDPAGLYGEWRVSRTAAGDETLELIRDGALSELSIGFRGPKSRRLADGTIEHTRANLIEVAVVLEGAYGPAAAVAGVRSADETETDETAEALERLRLPELDVAAARSLMAERTPAAAAAPRRAMAAAILDELPPPR